MDGAGAVHIVSTAFRHPNDVAVRYFTNRGMPGDAGAPGCKNAKGAEL